MARYLITGIAGFIGSSIARTLVLRGDQVSGIDNFSSGERSNLYPLFHAMRIFNGDISDEHLVRRACEGVDFFIHEADTSSPEQSFRDPAGTEDINLSATANIIRVARMAGVKRLVFASSSVIYGEADESPTPETAIPKPLSSFGYQKLAAELAFIEAWEMEKLETVCLRYFNVFGPRQTSSAIHSKVIARLIQQMMIPDVGNPVQIYGDGEQTRDFVYIDDVVSASLAACVAPSRDVAGKVFNIGGGVAFTVNQIADIIGDQTAYGAVATHLPARKGEVRQSLGDLSRSKESLGYSPKTDLRHGIAKTIEWFRETEKSLTSTRKIHQITSIESLRKREREGLIDDLREAVSCGNFDMAFQPIVSLEHARITAVEALLRWHNRGKNIPAHRFIPLAEETGMIYALGAWAVRHACSVIGNAIAKLPPDFRLSVNVSPSQLQSGELLQVIREELKKGNLKPRNLEIEMTERVYIHDWAKLSRELDLISHEGVSIALDDFGSGYSNIESLCRLKVNRIKINRSISMVSRAQLPVLDGIVAMANKLSIAVVAEKVESAPQFERVKAAGCTEAQGYFIARPLSAEDLLRVADPGWTRKTVASVWKKQDTALIAKEQ